MNITITEDDIKKDSDIISKIKSKIIDDSISRFVFPYVYRNIIVTDEKFYIINETTYDKYYKFLE